MTVHGAVQQALHGRQLPPPTDQIRLGMPGSAMLFTHAQQATGRNWFIGTLDLNQIRFAERCSVLNESRSRVAEHHSTRRGHRLHPLSHPDLLTDGGVSERA